MKSREQCTRGEISGIKIIPTAQELFSLLEAKIQSFLLTLQKY